MSADRSKRAAKKNISGSCNKYSYVQNEPVNFRDPRGREQACPDGYDPDDPSENCEDPDPPGGGVNCDVDPDAYECVEADKQATANAVYQQCISDGTSAANDQRAKAQAGYQQQLLQDAVQAGAAAFLLALTKGAGFQIALAAATAATGGTLITETPVVMKRVQRP